MRSPFFSFLAGTLASLSLSAHAHALPEGGTLITPPDAIASMRETASSAHGMLTRVKAEGSPFTSVIRCQTAANVPHPWSFQFQFRTTRRVEKGEVLLLTFHARTVTSKNESGEGLVHPIFEKAGPPHDKSLSVNLSVGREWKAYFFPFRSASTYEAGAAGTGFHLGLQEQTVEIAAFEVYSFGKNFDMNRLPRTRISYAGQEPDAPWRAAALERIERHRKADLAVTVTDAAGAPVPGAKVAVAMRRHAFGWGSCVTVRNLLRDDPDGEKYRAVIAENYTRVVFENDLKWPSWDNPANHPRIMQAADWLRDRNIEIRGHCLVWPSWKNTPKDLQSLKDNPEALRQRINSHIVSEVSAMRGRLVDWDVINEPYTNHDLMRILGDDEMIAWFKLARHYDPDVNLYLNDYAILSGGGLDKAHQDHFEKTLRFLKNGGAPITGLGMQGHFGGTPTPPERMLAILDRFAALGLDISITEHDIDTEDEQLQADFTRDFLTTVFSHPSVVAILTWGFWENSHWRPNGAYYRKDWSLKPAGQVWLDLVKNTWWTRAALTTADDGTARTRGFLGDYEVTVTHNGVTKTVPAKLTPSGATLTIRL